MNELYDWLLSSTRESAPLQRLCLGINWTMAEVGTGAGFAFSPRQIPRTLSWAGTLQGQGSEQLRPWLQAWDEAEAAVGLAVLNACINAGPNCAAEAQLLSEQAPGHLQVFAHMRPRLEGRKVVVIGHYPGLDSFWQGLPYVCLERQRQDGDLPDSAAEYLLPEADWVFISASSIANKTLPRLLQLAQHAQVVLMGPSLPWLRGWQRFGVNYLAGVRVHDSQAAMQVAMQGGGTRLFAGPVQYALLAL